VIATGTILSDKLTLIIGKVKSNAVAPLYATTGRGCFLPIAEIRIIAIISRIKSIKNAAVPNPWGANCPIKIPDNVYQPYPEDNTTPVRISIPKIFAEIIPATIELNIINPAIVIPVLFVRMLLKETFCCFNWYPIIKSITKRIKLIIRLRCVNGDFRK